MELTKKQAEGLKIAVNRYNAKEKYTVISGYAGAGKSTLVNFIIQALNIDPKKVCFAAFTGKAAQVLLKKGNKNVSTLHKLLYKSIPNPDGSFSRFPVPSVDYDLVIVDEVSMAPKSMMELLFKYRPHVICLGDPFQIEPIDPKEDNHLLDAPHIFLDEIMRQAQESEIIRASMQIRENKPLEKFGKEVKIFNKAELSYGMLSWADQVLVATNNTKDDINNKMRQAMGRGPMPENGEKIICLRNYWDLSSEEHDEPIVNGTIGFLDKSFSSFDRIPYFINGGQDIEIIRGNFISDSNETFVNLNMDKKLMMTGEKSLTNKTEYILNKNRRFRHLVPKEFSYGYAITGHRAQGSEWSKVLVIEEGFPTNKISHARWLYTCVTRASEKLVLIKK